LQEFYEIRPDPLPHWPPRVLRDSGPTLCPIGRQEFYEIRARPFAPLAAKSSTRFGPDPSLHWPPFGVDVDIDLDLPDRALSA